MGWKGKWVVDELLGGGKMDGKVAGRAGAEE